MAVDNQSSSLSLTKREAQALAVIASGLDRRPFSRRVRASDILATIQHLGCIQLDTISVISRAHETALWSRLGPYDRRLITALFADHALTEYWAHAAAIIPATDLPMYRGIMLRARERQADEIAERDHDGVAALLGRIERDGAVSSRDFEAPAGVPRADAWSWYGNKPERGLLMHLWHLGEVVVSMRDETFARYYDLPHRVVDGFWDAPLHDPDAVSMSFTRRALRALGVTTLGWCSDYFRSGRYAHVSVSQTQTNLQRLVEAGEAVPVEVASLGQPAWLDVTLVPTLQQLRSRRGWPTLTTFLSPFDNLVWNRDRMARLWDLDYRLEIYVPEARRTFGYYAMPILYRGRLVGLIDPSYDRRRRHLTIRNLALRSGERPSPQIARAIAWALDDLLRFLGGEPGAWSLGRVDPADLRTQLSGYSSSSKELDDSSSSADANSGESVNDVNT